MKRYISDSKKTFDDIVSHLVLTSKIREITDDYIQTYCGIHVKYLGHNIITTATYDEGGNEITQAVFSNYVMIDIIGYYNNKDLTEVFPETPNHKFS